MSEIKSKIRKTVEKSKLVVSRVYYGDFQKEGDGKMTAELKQKVTSTAWYPKKSVSSDLQDNIYAAKDFGFDEEPYVSESTRVAWIDVPEESTVDTVTADLAAFTGAEIYRIMSNEPVLSDNQKFAVDSPNYDASMDSYANRQVVREGTEDGSPGPLALYNGKVQYKSNFFSKEGHEDVDLRTVNPKEMFISEELQAELDPAFQVSGQKL